MGFSDREIFRLVRETRKFTVSAQLASRVTPQRGDPDGAADPARRRVPRHVRPRHLAALVRRSRDAGSRRPTGSPCRWSIGAAVSLAGSAEAARGLPVAVRLAAAIVGGQQAFRDYGQDGQLYDFRLLPLADTSIFVVAAAPVVEGFSSLLADWGGFVLVVLALGAALLAVWLGADRWCVQPLRYIRDFADRVARGDDMKLEPSGPGRPELASVGEGVRAMAAAIASREAELRDGLEQRDHMLREIHHRVKNNLQMISSLLNLQAGEIRSPRIRRFFGDAQNRVLTLSILHRHLYERSSWALVDFQQFISDLVRQISVGRRSPDRPHAALPDPGADHGGRPRHRHSRRPDRHRGGEQRARPQLQPRRARPKSASRRPTRTGRSSSVIEDNGAGGGGSLGSDARGGFGLTLIRGLAMQLGGEAQISPREGGGTRVVGDLPHAAGRGSQCVALPARRARRA